MNFKSYVKCTCGYCEDVTVVVVVLTITNLRETDDPFDGPEYQLVELLLEVTRGCTAHPWTRLLGRDRDGKQPQANVFEAETGVPMPGARHAGGAAA